jgi:hypothetical protein
MDRCDFPSPAFLLALSLLAASSAFAVSAAEDKAGGDLRAAVQNPISSLISVPFKLAFDGGADNGGATVFSVQPVVPVTVGKWNFVSRLIAPIINAPGDISGLPEIPNPTAGNRVTGLGDFNYSLFLSPVEYDKVIWGVGPSLSLPTATEEQLGSGKWSLGPTAVALTQPAWGSVGILGRHLWDVAGDADRSSVNQTLIEPFANYNLDEGWFLVSDLVVTADWQADSGNRWTVPLGGGMGRLFKFGDQPVNARIEAYWNVEKPDGAPDWQVSFTWQFLFPK